LDLNAWCDQFEGLLAPPIIYPHDEDKSKPNGAPARDPQQVDGFLTSDSWDELMGKEVEILVPERFRTCHREDRATY
jgi:hypothetical protein